MQRTGMPRRKTSNVSMLTVERYEKTRQMPQYEELEKYSQSFVENTREIMADYEWSKDPFHAWSRGFEYTYVWNEISRRARQRSAYIADLGGGVTFFPFFLNSKGHNVDVYDLNTHYLKKYHQISGLLKETVRFYPRSLDFMDKTRLYDYLACISVIEHIPISQYPDIVRGIFNMLRPGGAFFFTLDLYQHKGTNGVEAFLDELNHVFGSHMSIEFVHYDANEHVTPRYVSDKYGCADRFSLSLRKMLFFLKNGRMPEKYPKINIVYGFVEKKPNRRRQRRRPPRSQQAE